MICPDCNKKGMLFLAEVTFTIALRAHSEKEAEELADSAARVEIETNGIESDFLSLMHVTDESELPADFLGSIPHAADALVEEDELTCNELLPYGGEMPLEGTKYRCNCGYEVAAPPTDVMAANGAARLC